MREDDILDVGLVQTPLVANSNRRFLKKVQCNIFNVCLVLILVVLIVLYYSNRQNELDFSDTFSLEQWSVLTSLGRKSYKEIEEVLYRDLGYQIAAVSYPLVRLEMLKKPSCAKDWSAIAKKFDPKTIPPRDIPEELKDEYLMKNLSFLRRSYFNNKHNSGVDSEPFDWPESLIERRLQQQPSEYVKYGAEGMAVHHALQYFQNELLGKSGLVIGSITPWVEVFALRAGAEHITTAEYQVILTGHPKMSYVHPLEQSKDFTKYLEKYDFAVSFSSVEHSGLGRYGDIIDPIGDIREVQKAWCELKQDGLFFLGLPVGRDSVLFNAHRMYGRIRLPILIEGFELIAVFYGDQPMPYNLTTFQFEKPGLWQPVFVLRKQ